jgi:hypothetical protein
LAVVVSSRCWGEGHLLRERGHDTGLSLAIRQDASTFV